MPKFEVVMAVRKISYVSRQVEAESVEEAENIACMDKCDGCPLVTETKRVRSGWTYLGSSQSTMVENVKEIK